jgi:hypothetical protein
LGGSHYLVTATPMGVDWDFGDGTAASLVGASAFGDPYPVHSSVTHVFSSHNQTGYAVKARVRYNVSWSEIAGASRFGPYPMGSIALDVTSLSYPVEQAQPELIDV